MELIDALRILPQIPMEINNIFGFTVEKGQNFGNIIFKSSNKKYGLKMEYGQRRKGGPIFLVIYLYWSTKTLTTEELAGFFKDLSDYIKQENPSERNLQNWIYSYQSVN